MSGWVGGCERVLVCGCARVRGGMCVGVCVCVCVGVGGGVGECVGVGVGGFGRVCGCGWWWRREGVTGVDWTVVR